ncbi:MAG: hypothetical protein MSS84_05120 [Bacteroidales bacterium]|nr:hypothetical protein [Bacteroidales bacterium]
MKHLKTFTALCCVATLFAACEKNDVEPTAGDANGHDYIDLGLSVKWATCNIGATTPEGYGHYYAWGETKPKTTYDWSTYKWCNESATTLTKYNTSSNYGTVDNKTSLELADDAAHVHWGGTWRMLTDDEWAEHGCKIFRTWRMPTDAEWTELRDSCTWTWTTLNGVKGYEVTSKTNGNSIFLPAAGFYSGDNVFYTDHYGCYWSSSLDTDAPNNAKFLEFWSEDNDAFRNYYGRCCGQPIRAVMEQEIRE